MQSHRQLVFAALLIFTTLLIFSGIYIQNNITLVNNSKELIQLQLINRYSDQLGGNLGNFQTSAKSYAIHRNKAKLDSIKAFKNAGSQDLKMAIKLSQNKVMRLSFDSLKFLFDRESAYVMTSISKLPEKITEKQAVDYYEDNEAHVGSLWWLIEKNRIRQKKMVMDATIQTQHLGERSMYMSIGGLTVIFIVFAWSFINLNRSNRKRLLAEEKEKQSLNLLKEHEMLMSAVINNSTSIIYIKNLKGEYSLVNKRFLEIYQTTEDKVIGKTERQLLGFKEIPESTNSDQLVFSNGTHCEYLEKVLVEGEERDYLTIKFPLKNDDDQLFGLGGISTDFTDRARYEEGLKLAQEEAEKARAFQERFLANMSHEIRTPMNGIMGMTNVLYNTGLNEEQGDFVRMIQQSVNNLMVIINDILDFSKIKAGMLVLENVPFNLQDVVKQVVLTLKPKADEKAVAIRYSIDKAVPKYLYGDSVRLNQIITNLVGNAIKFTEVGAVEVIVDAETDVDSNLTVQFSIKDSGIGIPENKQALVFESFTQSSAETTRKYGGTGLGLSIVKQLVELHAGEISISSKENVRSTFHVHILYKAAEDTKKDLVNAETKFDFSTFANKTVLVVDDNAIDLMVAKQTLKKAGIQVELASSGKKALEMLLSEDFFVVLMDVSMPEMNGYETTHKIRTELKMDIPIIAMTASAMVEDQERCINAGMDEYIAKPFVPQELFSKLSQFL